MIDLSVVFAYRRTNTYGPHVVAGALEVLPPPGRVTITMATPGAELCEAVAQAAAASRHTLVAWSFYSPDFVQSTQELAEVRRRIDVESVTHVAGGVHASAEPRQVLSAGWDLVAIGEGEATFAGLCAALSSGGEPTNVAGLGFFDGDGTYCTSGPATRHPLDTFPAFAAAIGRYNHIEITRGCVYACTFCQTPYLFKARFRHRSPANVAHHVALAARAGRRDVRFVTPTSLSYGSDDHSVNLAAIEELLGSVRAAVGTGGRIYFGSFPSEVRPEHVTTEALRLLKRFVNNDNLVIGGQSGSDEVLAAVNRGHRAADVERAVRLCIEEGFVPNVDLLFGLPGEDEAAAQTTARFAQHLADLGARIHAHSFMPLPGTPLRGAAAGRIDPAIDAVLERLTGRGRAYGQHRRQERIAEQLVGLSAPRRPRAVTTNETFGPSAR